MWKNFFIVKIKTLKENVKISLSIDLVSELVLDDNVLVIWSIPSFI